MRRQSLRCMTEENENTGGVECGYPGREGGHFLEPTCQHWSQTRPSHNRGKPKPPRRKRHVQMEIIANKLTMTATTAVNKLENVKTGR